MTNEERETSAWLFWLVVAAVVGVLIGEGLQP